MSIWKKILQALIGLIMAAAAALSVGTWVFPAENDLILAAQGFRLSVSGVGAGLSMLLLLAFADGWIGVRNRRLPEEAGSGRLWNGIGFGLLPAVAVWKVFEQHTALGRGNAMPEGMESLSFFAENGAWLPGRIELVLAIVVIAALVLWLALRKREMPENGDLLGVALACWSAARLVTEGFRAGQIAWLGSARIVGWFAAGVMLIILIVWSGRILRQKRNTGYVLACVPVFLISVAGVVLIQNGVIRSGIPALDLAAQSAFALLALKAVLCAGRVSR